MTSNSSKVYTLSKLKSLSDESLIVQFLKTKATLSPATIKNYRTLLKQLVRFIEQDGLSLVQVQEQHVSKFLAQYDYQSTKESYKTILTIFYKWAFKVRLVTENPAEDIHVGNGKRKPKELMSESEFKLILSRCDGLREMTLVSFLWFTGVRSKELRYIRLEDIDLERGLITVSNSKTTTGYRTLPIHPNFKNLIVQYYNRRVNLPLPKPEVWLFLTKRGSQFSDRTLSHLISSLQWITETSFSCHDFRRAFVTRLYRKTKDLVLCQRLAGHSSIETTRRYILDDPEEQRRKFNSLDF